MDTTKQHVLVAGAGAAGHAAATTLRADGFEGDITVLHGEDPAPYNRTLVNKGVLPGLLSAEQIALPSLDDLGVELARGRAVEVVDQLTAVVLDDGRRIAFDALVAATGSSPRPIENGPSGSARLVRLHTVEDAEHVRDMLGDQPGEIRVALLGAGFIGAETASYLHDLGATVHLVSQPATPLAPALGLQVAHRVNDLHRANVDTHFGRTLVDLTADDNAVTVVLDDGTQLDVDLALIAYGTVPDSEWLTGQRLGVQVDDRLRASTRGLVYAAGSVAFHTASTGHRYRVDHWDAATAQGTHAARTLLHDLAGAPDPGAYSPTTGYTTALYRQPVASYGVPLPGAAEQQHETLSDGAILTTFHTSGSGDLTAAAGIGAGRDLMSMRDHLRRP